MHTRKRIKAVFFDMGDVLIQENTTVKDENRILQQAELVPGARETLLSLKKEGYLLALVSDTRVGAYRNALFQHGLYSLFDAFAISEEMGCTKPGSKMFIKALKDLGIKQEDYYRVIMVGNNLERDIIGANHMGLVSVWFYWNKRHRYIPENRAEIPDFTIHRLPELINLIEGIEGKLQNSSPQYSSKVIKRYAPIILVDEKDPYLPVMTGGAVIDSWQPSPTFPRIIKPPEGGQVIEYALYWDWVIDRHSNLENIWIHLDKRGKIVLVEGTARRRYFRIWPFPLTGEEYINGMIHQDLYGKYIFSRDEIELERKEGAGNLPRQVEVYTQPGRQGFAAAEDWFKYDGIFALACQEKGDSYGVYAPETVGEDFKNKINPWLAGRYLYQSQLIPSFCFNKKIVLAGLPLLPVKELLAEIPRRIECWMEVLHQEKDLPMQRITASRERIFRKVEERLRGRNTAP